MVLILLNIIQVKKGGQGIVCETNCINCDENKQCFQCKAMEGMILKNHKCICDQGFFLKSTPSGDICQSKNTDLFLECGDFCEDCDSENECNNCANKEYVVKKEGKCECIGGYFETGSGEDKNCRSII